MCLAFYSLVQRAQFGPVVTLCQLFAQGQVEIRITKPMNEVTTIARWFSWTGDSATKSTWWVTKHAGFDFARSLKKH